MCRAPSEFDSRRLTPWQASQIYHALTKQKTVVSSKESLQLVCLVLDHIHGDAVDDRKSDKQKQDPYKPIDMLAPPADKSVGDLLGAPQARQGSKADSVLAGAHSGC